MSLHEHCPRISIVDYSAIQYRKGNSMINARKGCRKVNNLQYKLIINKIKDVFSLGRNCNTNKKTTHALYTEGTTKS